jgi:hypothetical protein
VDGSGEIVTVGSGKGVGTGGAGATAMGVFFLQPAESARKKSDIASKIIVSPFLMVIIGKFLCDHFDHWVPRLLTIQQ